MAKKITPIYSYTETDNPYANNEDILISLIETDDFNRYYEFSVSNDACDGCSIFLTEKQVKDLTNILNAKILS